MTKVDHSYSHGHGRCLFVHNVMIMVMENNENFSPKVGINGTKEKAGNIIALYCKHTVSISL